MLLRFGVENHGSIATYQELQLTATALKDAAEGLFTVGPDGTEGKALRVVPVVGIYGANASGKSTLLKAFGFFCDGIVTSHVGQTSSAKTPFVPFRLDKYSKTKPSRYDADIVLDNVRYHYGYTLDGKRIVNEWLYSFDLTANRQVRSILFMRETADDLKLEFQFGKSLRGENKQISKFVRPNSLFLSAAAQNAHPQLTPIFDFFYKQIAQRLDGDVEATNIPAQLSTYFSSDEARKATAIQFLKAADVGISGMDFSKIPIGEKEALLMQDFEQLLRKHLPTEEGVSLVQKEKAKVNLLHIGAEGGNYPISLNDESTGTLALLQLLGPAFARLSSGGVLIVDELNSALHPLVSRELIRLFSSPATNPGHAQLIFTTHDTNLLSGGLLRRDQIWFTEKDPGGASHIYALSDIKVRANDNLERGYLMGRFGAIPFVGCGLGEFASLFRKSIQVSGK